MLVTTLCEVVYPISSEFFILFQNDEKQGKIQKLKAANETLVSTKLLW